MAVKRTASGEWDKHLCIRGVYSNPYFSIMSTLLLRLLNECMPVDITVGLPKLATCSINGKLSASPEPILNASTPISFKKFAALRENGVDK